MESEVSIQTALLSQAYEVPQSAPSIFHLLRKTLLEQGVRKPVLSGLYWFFRKSQIPEAELLSLTRHAYPGLTESGVRSSVNAHRGFWSFLSSLSAFKLAWRGLNNKHRTVELTSQLWENPQALRIADWTAALMLEFDERRTIRKIPKFRLASFGLCQTSSEQYKFGISIFADEDDHSGTQEFQLNLQDHVFPVIVHRGLFIRDSPPGMHPVNGTGSCWAITQEKQTDPGFLTASHLVDSPRIGNEVSTTSGLGYITAIGPPGIDAMVVTPAKNAPTSLANNGRSLHIDWLHHTHKFTSGA